MAAPAKKLEDFSNAEVLQHLQANGLGALCATFEENEVTGKFRTTHARTEPHNHIDVLRKA